MSNIVRRTSFIITGIFLASLVFAFTSSNLAVSASTNDETTRHCPDHSQTGWALDKVESSSGDKTVDGVRFKWSGDPGVLTVKNKNAYKVTVTWCAKGGTNFYNSSKNTGEIVTEISPDQKVTVNFNTEVSYFMVYKIEKHETTSKYLFQFAKKWAGDEISLDGVEVSFFVGDFEWKIGDPAVPVKPGQELSPLSEEVTGLPENCSYKSDLPESYIVFEELLVDRSRSIAQEYEEEPEVMTDTLTVTNTVTCEEGTVAGATTTPPPAQVAVTPVGAADAGGAGTTAFVGLVGSAIAVSFGAVIRKFSL